MRLSLDRSAAVVCALVLALSLATVYDQFRGLAAIAPDGNPHHFVETAQVIRNHQTLHGQLGDPWRFRIGSEWLAHEARHAAQAIGFREPAVAGFLAFRVLQNIGIFGLAWLLYRRLGLGRAAAAVGLALVAYALTQSLFDAGLAFDTYGDVVVYLAGAVLALEARWEWLIPLVVVGAVNRETCGLVALIPLVAGWRLGRGTPEGRRAIGLGLAALAAWAMAVASVRLLVGPAHLILPYGHHPGLDLLGFNLRRAVTWDNLFRTVTVVPFLALWQVRSWPPILRDLAIAIVPIWLVAHFLGAVVAETRLMLVPYVVVLVPGALMGFRALERRGIRHPAEASA